MTVKELSEYLRLDRMTIYKMLKEGSIPASRIGHQWRFFRSEIDEWIRSLRAVPQTSVLVIDGGADVKKLLDEGMTLENFNVTRAATGEEAANLASEYRFDLVFFELKKATIEAFRQIRAVDSLVPVVVLAGPSDARLVDQAMDVGTFTLMKKPASSEDVKKILGSLPTRKSSEA